jgi:hypothetical protein
MESKGNRHGGDNDHALIGQTKKGRGKGPNKGVIAQSVLAQSLKASRPRLA